MSCRTEKEAETGPTEEIIFIVEEEEEEEDHGCAFLFAFLNVIIISSKDAPRRGKRRSISSLSLSLFSRRSREECSL